MSTGFVDAKDEGFSVSWHWSFGKCKTWWQYVFLTCRVLHHIFQRPLCHVMIDHLGCGHSPSLSNLNLFFVIASHTSHTHGQNKTMVGRRFNRPTGIKDKNHLNCYGSMELNETLRPRTPPDRMKLDQIITSPNNYFIYDLTLALGPTFVWIQLILWCLHNLYDRLILRVISAFTGVSL